MWDDQQQAASFSKRLADIEKGYGPFLQIRASVSDIWQKLAMRFLLRGESAFRKGHALLEGRWPLSVNVVQNSIVIPKMDIILSRKVICSFQKGGWCWKCQLEMTFWVSRWQFLWWVSYDIWFMGWLVGWPGTLWVHICLCHPMTIIHLSGLRSHLTTLMSMNLMTERADMLCIVSCMFQSLILGWNSANWWGSWSGHQRAWVWSIQFPLQSAGVTETR
jgi:hypothetical protein